MWNFSWLDIWWQSFRRPLCLLSCLCGLLLQQKISTRHHCDSHTWQPLTVSICQYTISKSAFELLRCSLHLLFWGWVLLTVEYWSQPSQLYLSSWGSRVFKSLQESSRVFKSHKSWHVDHIWPRRDDVHVNCDPKQVQSGVARGLGSWQAPQDRFSDLRDVELWTKY